MYSAFDGSEGAGRSSRSWGSFWLFRRNFWLFLVIFGYFRGIRGYFWLFRRDFWLFRRDFWLFGGISSISRLYPLDIFSYVPSYFGVSLPSVVVGEVVLVVIFVCTYVPRGLQPDKITDHRGHCRMMKQLLDMRMTSSGAFGRNNVLSPSLPELRP